MFGHLDHSHCLELTDNSAYRHGLRYLGVHGLGGPRRTDVVIGAYHPR